tara:strand:- start:86 stop:535 length:450 start_codon:yes stop_codon:yes gene_type:complete
MSLQNKITDDIKSAMRSRSVDQLAALRNVKTEITLELTKDGSKVLSDKIVMNIILRLIKQRRDAANIYNQQGRKDLADDEMKQLVFLEKYLPEQMNDQEVRKVVKDVLNQLGATNLTDLGKCMGLLMNKLKGRADGSLISQILREELTR